MTGLMPAVLAGLALGVVGSTHCVVMCGPLVLLSAPRDGAATRTRAWHAALYHAGRVATYVALGLLVGLAGDVLVRVGFGRMLAVAAGTVLVVHALTVVPGIGRLVRTPRLGAIVTQVLGRAGRWMHTHRVRGPLALGALNGLLPCGLLYAALTSAAGLGEPRQAMAVMAAFGIGTVPVLAALGVVGGTLAAHVPAPVRRASPAVVAAVGVLLILRGLGMPAQDQAAPAGQPKVAGAHGH